MDLNRDFPDRFDGMVERGDEQPETRVMMEWTLKTGFVAAASMHEVSAAPRCSKHAWRIPPACGLRPLSALDRPSPVILPGGTCCERAAQLAAGRALRRVQPPPPTAAAAPPQGALVANYPWDGTPDRSTRYEACPDDAAFRHLAALYATAHRRMSQPDNQVGLVRCSIRLSLVRHGLGAPLLVQVWVAEAGQASASRLRRLVNPPPHR